MTSKQYGLIIKDRKLFGSIMMMIVGLFFLGHHLLKGKVNSEEDLIELKAKINNYSFNEHKGFRTHTYYYYIFLDNYETKFQVSADIVDYFDKSFFERKVALGDTLRIFISKSDFLSIDNKQKTKIFGIYKNSATFLDLEHSIAQYNNELILYGGLFFLFVGIILFNNNKHKLKE